MGNDLRVVDPAGKTLLGEHCRETFADNTTRVPVTLESTILGFVVGRPAAAKRWPRCSRTLPPASRKAARSLLKFFISIAKST